MKEGFFLRFDLFNEMKKTLEEVLSPSASSAILGIMGRSCGKKSYKRIQQEYESKEEVLRELCILKRKENWGEIAFQEIDSGSLFNSGRITVRNSLETRGLKKQRKEPYCLFFKGFLRASFLNCLENPLRLLRRNVLLRAINFVSSDLPVPLPSMLKKH